MKQGALADNINLITIIAVYFLMLVGGIVRSMGAGMGCPDWPKCFDSYIPPTNSSGLPAGYEQLYVDARVDKNKRLSNLLSVLGFNDLANQVKSDPSIDQVTVFDARKAWVEYVNRLMGVVIGFLILLNAAFSFKYRMQNVTITVLGIGCLFLVLFQGWLGSLVVSTNLLPGFISVHMLLALLLVSLLIYQRYLMRFRKKNPHSIQGINFIIGLLFLFLFQIILGVQVREEVDIVKRSILDRTEWIDSLGIFFYIHRSYSLVILSLVGYIFYLNKDHWRHLGDLKLLFTVILLEVLLGVIMAYFEIPTFAQPLHLLLGCVAFGSIVGLTLSASKGLSI